MPPVAVAMKVRVATPGNVAESVCCPGVGPRIHLPETATPLASVRATPSITVPPPRASKNTETSFTGRPSLLDTRTAGGVERG